MVSILRGGGGGAGKGRDRDGPVRFRGHLCAEFCRRRRRRSEEGKGFIEGVSGEESERGREGRRAEEGRTT